MFCSIQKVHLFTFDSKSGYPKDLVTRLLKCNQRQLCIPFDAKSGSGRERKIADKAVSLKSQGTHGISGKKFQIICADVNG